MKPKSVYLFPWIAPALAIAMMTFSACSQQSMQRTGQGAATGAVYGGSTGAAAGAMSGAAADSNQ